MVVLIAGPRPAIEFPKPWSDVRASARVSGGKLESTSSSSGAFGVAFLIGIVSPSWKVLAGAAGDQLHVLQAECGARPHRQRRIHRQRLDRLVELEVEHGDGALLAVHDCTRSLLMSLTMPTRKPPARTSLPFTSFAPFGTWALSW